MSVLSREPESTTDESSVRSRGESVLRRLAAITAAGVILGLVVGGIGGRLAMLLLARLNPDATGVTSDDGFEMGQLTLSTFSLLAAGASIGLLGAGFYALLRCLAIGPRWFQVASFGVGPAVVVGEMLVHTSGIDFRLLDPLWLDVALFVAIPGFYGALMAVVAERWLRPGSWFSTAPLRRVSAILVAWVLAFPLLPVLLVLVVLWFVRDAALQRRPAVYRRLAPIGGWVVRASLAALFVVQALRLMDDVRTLS